MGLSMGGALALRLAEQRGGEVAGIVLVNPYVVNVRRSFKLLPVLKLVAPTVKGVAGDIKKPGTTEVGIRPGATARPRIAGGERRPNSGRSGQDHPAAPDLPQQRRPCSRAGQLSRAAGVRRHQRGRGTRARRLLPRRDPRQRGRGDLCRQRGVHAPAHARFGTERRDDRFQVAATGRMRRPMSPWPTSSRSWPTSCSTSCAAGVAAYVVAIAETEPWIACSSIAPPYSDAEGAASSRPDPAEVASAEDEAWAAIVAGWDEPPAEPVRRPVDGEEGREPRTNPGTAGSRLLLCRPRSTTCRRLLLRSRRLTPVTRMAWIAVVSGPVFFLVTALLRIEVTGLGCVPRCRGFRRRLRHAGRPDARSTRPRRA